MYTAEEDPCSEMLPGVSYKQVEQGLYPTETRPNVFCECFCQGTVETLYWLEPWLNVDRVKACSRKQRAVWALY